jgi:mRNA-degrading endonuclease RelE of RelBE toxin-antitoxin system
MKRVELSDQVRSFVRSRAPEPRKQLRNALRDLARERGEIKQLEGALKDYFRLRVAGYRIVFAYSANGRAIRCLFVERRNIVYEIFEQVVRSQFLARKK